MSSRESPRALLIALAALGLLGVGGVFLFRDGGGGGAEREGKTGTRRDDRKQGAASGERGVLSWLDEPSLPRRRVAGVVVKDGAPFAGADLRLEGTRSGVGASEPLRARSDESGAFDFGPIVAGSWVVIAEAPGATGDVEFVDLRDPSADPAPDRLRLVLRACDAALFGVVRDASGGVVSGARVRHANGPVAISDAEGRYELCSRPGGTRIIAEADGYGAVTTRLVVYGRDRLDLSLLPEATVTGVVLRASDDAPVSDALVQIVGAEPEDGVALRSAISDAEGRFRVSGLSAGRVRATAIADGAATADPIEVTVEAGLSFDDLVLRVDPTFEVSGRVVDDGKPVAGAEVAAQGHGERAPRAESVTQDDGSFRLRGLFPGTLELSVPGWEIVAPRNVRLEARHLDGVSIEVDALASISGRVLARGKPVEGARVWTQGASSSSGDDGRYELTGLRAGEHKLFAESLAEAAYTRDVPVRLAAREQRTGVDIEMDLVGSISGVVVEQDGTPVPGVHVRFMLIEGRDFGFATTAADGTFTAGALSGGGEYSVDVRARPRSDVPIPPADGGVFPNVHVKDGTTRVEGVRLVVRLGKLEIAGRVVSTAGNPIPDVKVQATPDEGSDHLFLPTWMDLPTAITDAEGSFAIPGLLPGTYVLVARSPGGPRATVRQVAAGASDVRIELPEPSAIEGVLVGFAEGRVNVVAHASAHGDYREYEARVDGTTFELRALPPGIYLVGARGAGEADVKQVELAAGETAKVVLTSRGRAELEGRVVDARDGAGVPGARCDVMPSLTERGRPIRSHRDRGAATTGADGGFTLAASAGPGVLLCRGRDEGEFFHEARPVALKPGETTRIDLRVIPVADGAEEADVGLLVSEVDGATSVVHVVAGGPAAEAGVRVNDRLVQVDGIDLGGLSVSAVSSLLVFRAPGSRVELTVLRDGETLRFSFVARASEHAD